MKPKIFIDGESGTTGLQIKQRLIQRRDLHLLSLPEEIKKDKTEKLKLYRQAEVVIFCLPDAASQEAWELAKEAGCKVIDASSAFRVHSEWVYGLAELGGGQREKIRQAQWVSNPGCYATGFLLAFAPLVRAGLVQSTELVTLQGISGYSGGGKRLIESYQSRPLAREGFNARPYALGLRHKHLLEMQRYAGLDHAPIFTPLVGNFAQGMLVSVPLFASQVQGASPLEAVIEVWRKAYAHEALVEVRAANEQADLEDGFFDPAELAGQKGAQLFVWGHKEQILLQARLDNLGKGASGACVQNLNLLLGQEERLGLD